MTGVCECGNEIWVHKIREISWLAGDLIAAHDGLFSMGLVSSWIVGVTSPGRMILEAGTLASLDLFEDSGLVAGNKRMRESCALSYKFSVAQGFYNISH